MSDFTLVIQPPAQITTVIEVGQPTLSLTIVSEAAVQTVIQPPAVVSLIMGAALSTEVIVQPPAQTTTIFQVGQGPAGPIGPAGEGVGVPILGKSLTLVSGALTEVRLYSDAAKTTLVSLRKLYYSGTGLLSWVEYFDSDEVLVSTQTLQYVDGALVGTVTN